MKKLALGHAVAITLISGAIGHATGRLASASVSTAWHREVENRSESVLGLIQGES